KHTQVIADCNAHGQLTQQYTLGQLRQALTNIPPAIQEYTNCYDVIQRQLLAQLGQSSGSNKSGGGGGGSFLPVPVIIVLAVLLLAAAGYAVMAIRRREDGGGPPD